MRRRRAASEKRGIGRNSGEKIEDDMIAKAADALELISM